MTKCILAVALLAFAYGVIPSGGMTNEDRIEIGVAGTLGVLLTVATPELPRDAKIILWLAYLAFLYGLAIYKIRRNSRYRMTFPLVLCGGLLFGAIAAVVAWYVFPPPHALNDKVGGIVSVPHTQELSEPGDLEFYFHSFFASVGSEAIQYGQATVTNRSPRSMHLELWAHIDYFNDIGEPGRLGFQPEWNPEGLKEHTGENVIDFGPWETKEGRLVLFLPDSTKYGVAKWQLDMSRNIYIHAFDSVTGKHIAFKPMSGYPVDKMPWPLPSHKQLLALKFPKAAASKNPPPLDSLELLARTQFVGYQSDRLSFEASITNLSKDRMILQFNLLTRKSVDDKEWRTFRAVLVPSREKNKNHLDYYALDFGPGDVAHCSLVFANTGFTNEAGKELEESPSLTLFEIFDEVSRKKVWCAVEPGYPPGTDMRWATIQPPPPIPESDLDNPQADESKDIK